MDTRRTHGPGGPRHGRRIAAAAAVLLLCGCAYFNTFYNAKAAFKKAESERAVNPVGGGESYQRCIDKCLTLLRYYPKSKYVDDAMYLIGLSHLHRGEYVQARASFESLLERFTDSEFAESACYHTGLAALRQGDTAGSSQAFATLSARFPKSPLNVAAAFRMAEARLEARDYERARAELRAFMEAHPGSSFEGEAHLRLARTYYDEKRFPEARTEYTRVLELRLEPDVRHEAELRSALALRAEAEAVLAEPGLAEFTKMYQGARRLETQAPEDADGGAEEIPGEQDADTVEAGEAAADSAVAAAAGAETTAAAPRILSEDQAAALRRAEAMLADAGVRLEALRKPAARLGRLVELDIERAVTRALLGDPADAIDDLDQIARTHPRSADAARARFEVGEVYRRLGVYDKARRAYDASVQEKRDAPVAEAAMHKSNAIAARAAAVEKLRRAPEVRRRWAEARAVAPGTDSGSEALEARIDLTADYEDLARELLHVAEIDLLELDQPLVALHEFEQLLEEYPESLQTVRAKFAIAWIYHHRLRDAQRARTAYERVAREHGDTPQGREARALLDAWAQSGPGKQGSDPSSRP